MISRWKTVTGNREQHTHCIHDFPSDSSIKVNKLQQRFIWSEIYICSRSYSLTSQTLFVLWTSKFNLILSRPQLNRNILSTYLKMTAENSFQYSVLIKYASLRSLQLQFVLTSTTNICRWARLTLSYFTVPHILSLILRKRKINSSSCCLWSNQTTQPCFPIRNNWRRSTWWARTP